MNVTVNGTNPYGENWSYEKHVKKHGIDTTQYIDAPPVVKAAVAKAAKDAQAIAAEMAGNSSIELEPGSNSSGLDTSHTPGIAVVLMPPNVSISDWEIPYVPPPKHPPWLPPPPPGSHYHSDTNNTNGTSVDEERLFVQDDIDEFDEIYFQMDEHSGLVANAGADVTSQLDMRNKGSLLHQAQPLADATLAQPLADATLDFDELTLEH